MEKQEFLSKIRNKIEPADAEEMREAKKRLNSIAKPLNSLGKMEDGIVKLAGIYKSASLKPFKKCVVVMCADNGVVVEGVTQVGSEITAVVAENMTCGKATINIMANKSGAEVFVVDIGMLSDIKNTKIINRKIAYGTKNFINEPAMSLNETINAIETGIDMVKSMHFQGYNLIATGEMGIGNTTTSSAVASCLLNKSPAQVTGRGAGLSNNALEKKINVIEKAIEKLKPDRDDAIDILSKFGGFDIAGLTGVFLGGAIYRTPILVDGLISSVAALLAIRICPVVKDYIFTTHISKEPAGKLLIDEIGLGYLLDLNMCLGEGTGAVMAFSILDMAIEIYNKMSSFDQAGIEAYTIQK